MSPLAPLLVAVPLSLAGAPTPAACPGVRVGEVRVVRSEIFEQDEDTGWAKRAVNALHVRTREPVVRREVLLRPDDPLDLEALAQSERNLRAQEFIAEVRIDLFAPDGTFLGNAAKLAETFDCSPFAGHEVVDVVVTTRDSWSTTVESTLRKQASRLIWELGVRESNLLGRGKTFEVAHREDIDRNNNRFVYRDPRLAGSRVILETAYEQGSDGPRFAFQLGRPFFSLDTEWAFTAGVESFDRTQPLYEAGEEVARLRALRQQEQLIVSRRIHRGRTSALRAHVGYRRLFEDVGVQQRDFGFLLVGLSLEQHRFLKLEHLNHERPEDVNLGQEWSVWFGASTSATGGAPGAAYYLAGSYSRGFALGPAAFLLARGSWQGRLQQGSVRNGLGEAKVTLVDRRAERKLNLATIWYRHGTRLDPDVQIKLGSDNGLRGYVINQWVGTRSLLLSAERRWFFDDDVLGLVSLGAAAFVDSGFAWPAGQSIDLGDLKTNVGVGLLIGRKQLSTERATVRLDVAYALDRASGRSRLVVGFGVAPPITR